MAFNKTFNQEEVARLKKLIQEGDQVLYEVDSLQVGLRAVSYTHLTLPTICSV